MHKRKVTIHLIIIFLFLTLSTLFSANEKYIKVISSSKDKGRKFEGIGALSAGASSRLLIDYPEPQRSIILDLLFKPKYGLSLHYLKVEVGSDANSTCGAEATHARTREEFTNPKEEYFQRGYEWWLMKEAKKRNPKIEIGVLAWGAPGWIGNGNFYSQDMMDYYCSFIKGAKKYYGVDVNYVGIWNEHKYKVPEIKNWIKSFRKTLNKNGLTKVGIVAADQNCNKYKIAEYAAQDKELMDAIAVFADHYPEWEKKRAYYSSDIAINSGKRIWNAESGPWSGNWGACSYIAKLNNRCYIEGKITRITSWSLISSYYDTLSLPSSGPMRANAPWCGYFEIQPAIWANAHTTQFVDPGWKYNDSGCGYIDTKNKKGSFVTLSSPGEKHDYTIIIETVDLNSPQTLTFKLPTDFSKKPIHVWRTLIKKHEAFNELENINQNNGEISITVQPNAIYSLTTTTGQVKASPKSPKHQQFPLPYKEDFENYSVGGMAKYFSDIQGAFEVVERPDGKGKCLEQKLTTNPIRWMHSQDKKANFTSLLGDKTICNYMIKTDVYPEGPGSVKLFARMGSKSMNRSKTAPKAGYYIEFKTDGHWTLYAGKNIIEAGTAKFAENRWHTITLSTVGTLIEASLNGKKLTSVDLKDKKSKDGKSMIYRAGLVGIGTEYNKVLFDNFELKAIKDSTGDIIPQPKFKKVSPHDMLKNISSSSGTTEYPPERAVDGDPQTFWNTPWKPKAPFPQDFDIELKEPIDISGISYLPRQDNNLSGTILEYEVYTSMDGKIWGDPTAKGTFVIDASEKEVLFEKPLNVKFIKLRSLSEQKHRNLCTSAAEINLLIPVNK